MSLRTVIEKKVFAGRDHCLGVNVKIIKKITTGAPASAAPVGTLCVNTFDSNDTYICTVATGTWVKINA